jgi:hypothetical protein
MSLASISISKPHIGWDQDSTTKTAVIDVDQAKPGSRHRVDGRSFLRTLRPVNAIIAHFQQQCFETGTGAIMNKHVSIPDNAWVRVADHSKPRLIANHGSPISPSLAVHHVLEADDNVPTRDHGTDRPGGAIAGSRRGAVEQTDWRADQRMSEAKIAIRYSLC